MVLEYLKTLVDKYGKTSLEDIAKTATEMDFNNPVVLVGCGLIALSLAGIGLYVLMLFMSALSFKNNSRKSEESSLYHLSSRISSLEMTLAEYKNTIKHLNQQIKSDKLSLSSDISRIKADIKNSVMEDLRTIEYRKVA